MISNEIIVKSQQEIHIVLLVRLSRSRNIHVGEISERNEVNGRPSPSVQSSTSNWLPQRDENRVCGQAGATTDQSRNGRRRQRTPDQSSLRWVAR